MIGLSVKDVEAATGGKYHVESLIGVGGMGAVYRGTHRELGSQVAIKILPPEVRSNPGRMARFRREAAVAARLSHPNIVPVFEFETGEEITYLVMPFIEGITLEQHLERHGVLDLPALRTMLAQLGSALSYAHTRGVVHRDIKPANILLEQGSGRWMLTDFGVARVVSMDGVTRITQTEATIGTLAYMAPEQLGGAKDVDGRADLYALATVAYEHLVGELPERDGPARSARSLLRHRPDLPPAVARAITAPLAAARDERPPSVDAWLAMVSPRRSRFRGRAGVAAAAAVVLAIGAWLGARGRPATAPAPDGPVIAVLPFTVEGTVPGLALDSVLPQLIAWELRGLPDHEILEDNRVRATLLSRYGNRLPSRDSLLTFVAGRLEADEVVTGSATVEEGRLHLRAEVYDPATLRRLDAADVEGNVGDLSNLVRQVVVEAFATRIASAFSGAEEPALPYGLAAVSAYFRGERAFRRGAFEDAVLQFDSVIALDSAYGPAHLKRMVALVLLARPSQVGAEIHGALDAAIRHRERLDPVGSRVLDMYAALLRDGTVPGALEEARTLVDDHPDAIDAWFFMGALQARFPALAGVPRRDARLTLNQVVARDPVFAAAYALLVQLAVLESESGDARAAIDRFLALDSTSVRAEMVRIADTLLFQPLATGRVLASLPERPTEVLEIMALGAGEVQPPGGGRAVAARAVDVLTLRAATDRERTVFFRMRLASLLGSGAHDRAQALLQQAASAGVPQAEIDRWTVLPAVTPIRLATDSASARRAAERLLAADDEPVVSRWLAARYLRRFDPTAAPSADRALREAAAGSQHAIMAASLQEDLAAIDLLAGGDTAGALSRWETATSRYSIETVALGFVGSLWPLHWDRIRLLAVGQADAPALAATRHFDVMTGFMDQLIWEPVLLTRAEVAERVGDRDMAIEAYRILVRAYAEAESQAAHVRDSVAAHAEALVR